MTVWSLFSLVPIQALPASEGESLVDFIMCVKGRHDLIT